MPKLLIRFVKFWEIGSERKTKTAKCFCQLVCGRTMMSSACGLGRSPGTYAAKLRARWMDSQAVPVGDRAKYWKLSLTGMAPGGCGTYASGAPGRAWRTRCSMWLAE